MSRRTQRKQAALDARATAILYAELTTLLRAGIPVARALTMVSGDNPAVERTAGALARRMEQGVGFAQACRQARLLAPVDDALLEAAEASGRLEAVTATLARWHEQRFKRASRTRGGLLLPAAVLVLGAFVNPLPALVSGELDGTTYLWTALTPIAVFAVLGVLILKLVRQTGTRRAGRAGLFDRLVLNVPIIGPYVLRRQVLNVLTALQMMLDAGVTADRALSLAATATNNAVIGEAFRYAARGPAQGQSVTDALADVRCVSSMAQQMIQAGEASGQLAQSLETFCRLESTEVEAIADQIFAWIPRIVYGLVSIWVVSGMF